MMTTKTSLCRWCGCSVEVTPSDEIHLDELLTQVDTWGEASLSEDAQALIHHGPLCETCKALA